ncbi:hypothetical protein FEM48_Zijuj01G0219200 [Ziziphus jujuba var. spinosa]|uniref:Uncharacterized protein n=1 Tax=Ziziphus jujuba var. spinosa TaxID=714518 RepID=A0A978W3S4_ZIZJJ|nr:hypothetical protein FEM48_Zijuj01G0219200 [Ziziphus jujuba var. spinosa]
MAPTVNISNSKSSFLSSSPATVQTTRTPTVVMKFFFEFVACWGLPITDRSSVPAAPASRADDAAKPLVVSSSSLRKRHRRKRGRLGHSGSASVAAAAAAVEWKPSLGSICEDKVVAMKGEEDRTAGGAERIVKRKSETKNARVHVRTFNEDYGRVSVPAVIPAFSPTPFMF